MSTPQLIRKLQVMAAKGTPHEQAVARRKLDAFRTRMEPGELGASDILTVDDSVFGPSEAELTEGLRYSTRRGYYRA
jgi:hypothetical protein